MTIMQGWVATSIVWEVNQGQTMRMLFVILGNVYTHTDHVIY